jgi:DNA-binding PadR family transcriptional regulator
LRRKNVLPPILKKLTPPDVLLLALVKYGLATSYDLLSQAGIPVSVTSPALQRLKESDLLTSTTGARNSERYNITKKGEDELRALLTSDQTRDFLWLSKSGIFESAHRSLFLTWLFSEAGLEKDVSWAIDELRFRSSKSERTAKEIQENIGRLPSGQNGDPVDLGRFVAMTYQWMKTVSDAALLKAQADALEKAAAAFSKMSPAPHPLREKAGGHRRP